MNKIININLAGRLIPIDELAYEQLHAYIEWLRQFFGREAGGDEIVRDMEDRIGELFQDRIKKGAASITQDDVKSMISIMGSPEQIVSEAGEETTPPPPQSDNAGQKTDHQATEEDYERPKRLSRSEKEKVLGGVCGGLAAYFNIDPAIARIAFVLISLAWGSGVIIYLLLWAVLPVSNDQPRGFRRRLYRNRDQKVAGGVCSGIAAYLNIDPIIPRLIFIAPVLGSVFFTAVDSNIMFLPVLTGGIPTFVLLYLILWASIPVANTVTEKLEMRGEKVDVQNLSQAIKDIGDSAKTAPEKNKSEFRKIISVIVKIFVFMILGFVLIILASVLIAVLASMFGLAASSAFVLPLSGIITDSETQKWLLWICIILALVIPFVSAIRILIRIISGKRHAGYKWTNIISSVLFIAGIFGLFWIGGSILSDFKARYHSRPEDLALSQPSNDTLVIRQAILESEDGGITEYDWGSDDGGVRFKDDSTIAISNISLSIEKSPDSLYHMNLQRSANGKNSKRAESLATPLQFSYHQEGSVLYLPQDFSIPPHQPFRGQQMSVTIQVPVGKVFKTEGLIGSYYTQRSFRFGRNRWEYHTENSDDDYEDGEYYRMMADGKGSSL